MDDKKIIKNENLQPSFESTGDVVNDILGMISKMGKSIQDLADGQTAIDIGYIYTFNSFNRKFTHTNNELTYDTWHVVTTDNTLANPGDIVIDDNGTVKYIDYRDPSVTELIDGANIYGVVVVPANHTDGNVIAAAIHLANNGNTATYGTYGTTVSNISTSTLLQGPLDCGYFPTNYNKIKAFHNEIDSVTYWDEYAEQEYRLKSPYNADGSVNSEFYTSHSILINRFTGQRDTAFLSAIPDATAAIACTQYSPFAASGKTYYLPSIAELAYLCVRFKQIEYSRLLCGGETMTNKWFWSSSQYSSDNAWGLNFDLNGYFGHCGGYGKGNDFGYVLAFVAF